MANQSVSKPRFWLDFTQLLRAKGYFLNPSDYGSRNATSGAFVNEDGDSDISADKNINVWELDYTNPTKFIAGHPNIGWRFWLTPSNISLPKEWRKLLSTINWLGFINHNIAPLWRDLPSPLTITDDMIDLWIDGNSNLIYHTATSYVNGDFHSNGYSIFTLSPDSQPLDSVYWHAITIGFSIPGYVAQNFENTEFELGAIPFGKYIDIDSSPDLSVKKTVEYDGSKSYRTVGGSDISTSDYQGQPDWLVGEPWTLKNYESSGRVGRNGRRSWELTFSYLSNDDVFYDWQELVVGGSAETSDGVEGDFNSTSEIQQIWDLTLGGALSFVFTPDKDATNPEFAVCRLDQDSLVATQVAFQTWNISMRVVEVW